MKSFQNHTDGTSLHVLDTDDTLADHIGSPGDLAVVVTASAVTFYAAKGPRVPGKGFGVWGAGISSGAVASVAGKTGVVTLVPGDVGLGNVDNTSNATERAAVRSLSNAEVVPRVSVTNAPGATPAVNVDLVDLVVYTGMTAAITSLTSGLTGTPVDGQVIRWRFTDNGTARAITWGASFTSSTYSTLPGTTVIGATTRVVTEYDAVLAKHVCAGVT